MERLWSGPRSSLKTTRGCKREQRRQWREVADMGGGAAGGGEASRGETMRR